MRFLSKAALGLLAVLFMVSAPAWAVGPVTGEVDAVWWANDFETSSSSTDGAAPGLRAELWLQKRYGFRAGRYTSDPDTAGMTSSDYTSVDFLWKAFRPTENNFIAVGLGWQDMDLATLGFADNTSGARLTAEGRLTFMPVLHGYAEASYFPSLDDAADTSGGTYRDMEGHEYELGVAWKVAPFVHLRAGYRTSNIEFAHTTLPSGEAESSGFLVGAGIHF